MYYSLEVTYTTLVVVHVTIDTALFSQCDTFRCVNDLSLMYPISQVYQYKHTACLLI